MSNNLESTVSRQDIEYLKTCGILAPGGWPDNPPQTQAQTSWNEAEALMRVFGATDPIKSQRVRGWYLGLDGPDAGPIL